MSCLGGGKLRGKEKGASGFSGYYKVKDKEKEGEFLWGLWHWHAKWGFWFPRNWYLWEERRWTSQIGRAEKEKGRWGL